MTIFSKYSIEDLKLKNYTLKYKPKVWAKIQGYGSQGWADIIHQISLEPARFDGHPVGLLSLIIIKKL